MIDSDVKPIFDSLFCLLNRLCYLFGYYFTTCKGSVEEGDDQGTDESFWIIGCSVVPVLSQAGRILPIGFNN